MTGALELVRKLDVLLDPWSLLLEPARELQRMGWFVLVPPFLGASVVGLTLSSVELGLLFVAIMVPLAAFFYWSISNLRRVRRTLHEINNTLQVIVGRDPEVMKRVQDAHRQRLTNRFK